MSLTEFLLARIAEDEDAARDAEPGPWRLDELEQPTAIIGADGDPVIRAAKGEFDWTFQTSFVAHHVVRWNPARVLAECEAKRRIVDAVERGDAPAYLINDTAQVYADHADYREEWRP